MSLSAPQPEEVLLVTSLVQISVCAEDSSSVALGPASGAGGARVDGDGDTPFLLRPSVVLFNLSKHILIYYILDCSIVIYLQHL